MYREPPGEPDARARRAKELRQVVERQSRGTPAMQKKTKKRAQGTCGDSLSPRFTGLKNILSLAGASLALLAYPCLSSFAPRGLLISVRHTARQIADCK